MILLVAEEEPIRAGFFSPFDEELVGEKEELNVGQTWP